MLPLIAAATVAAVALGVAAGTGAFADRKHDVVPATSEPLPLPSKTNRTSAPTYAALHGALRTAFSKAVQVDPVPYYVPRGHPLASFSSPTGNIGCEVGNETGNSIWCVIVQYDFGQPGADCQYGAKFELDPDGYAAFLGCYPIHVNPRKYRGLPYGHAITNGYMSCVSNIDAVTCVDLKTDTGFSLSRSAFTSLR
jgi:hypothetical protein